MTARDEELRQSQEELRQARAELAAARADLADAREAREASEAHALAQAAAQVLPFLPVVSCVRGFLKVLERR